VSLITDSIANDKAFTTSDDKDSAVFTAFLNKDSPNRLMP
jgi:hypothetical protein